MTATGSGTKEENTVFITTEQFCRQFTLSEVQLATEDFSEANVLGNGGFGKVYKGQINNAQQTVAIKRLAPNSNQGKVEFLTEIETLSKLRHINLVSLLGYCNESGEMILVYEFIARGTLADHLYKLSSSDSEDCSSLSWKQCLNLCIGAGRGLDYLHTGASIIHRDVKSTNILLDENFTAKVSDFGLAKHLSISSSKSHVSTVVKGSFGYLDPSYFITCRLTRKSDTYAFGVVLLEVLCRRPAVDQSLGEDEMSLVMWAQEKISKGKVNQIVASNLRDEILADCLKTFVAIVKRCLNCDPKKRPTMARVVVQLEFALEQHNRKASTLNVSRFLPFWNRVKPSGSRGTRSTQKDHKQGDVHTLPTAITVTQEEALKDEHMVKMFKFSSINMTPKTESGHLDNYSSRYSDSDEEFNASLERENKIVNTNTQLSMQSGVNPRLASRFYRDFSVWVNQANNGKPRRPPTWAPARTTRQTPAKTPFSTSTSISSHYHTPNLRTKRSALFSPASDSYSTSYEELNVAAEILN